MPLTRVTAQSTKGIKMPGHYGHGGKKAAGKKKKPAAMKKKSKK